MYAMLDSVIARRRDGGEVRNDFLQTLLRKHAKDGTAADEDDGGGGGDRDADKLTDAQLKDNILTLLVAGHDTTTAGLTWLIKFLGENPEALQKLRVSTAVSIDSIGFVVANLRFVSANCCTYLCSWIALLVKLEGCGSLTCGPNLCGSHMSVIMSLRLYVRGDSSMFLCRKSTWRSKRGWMDHHISDGQM